MEARTVRGVLFTILNSRMLNHLTCTPEKGQLSDPDGVTETRS